MLILSHAKFLLRESGLHVKVPNINQSLILFLRFYGFFEGGSSIEKYSADIGALNMLPPCRKARITPFMNRGMLWCGFGAEPLRQSQKLS